MSTDPRRIPNHRHHGEGDGGWLDAQSINARGALPSFTTTSGGAANLSELGDVNVISTPPADNDSLTYDSTSGKWVPGVPAEPTADAHIADTSDAHDASAVSIADAGNYFTGTDVEAALQELGAGGGGGSVATDTIWDAAGDLAVGSGSNTAAKLSAGSEDDVLTIVSGVPAWAPPSGGGGLAHSFVGYNTVGGTWTAMTSGRMLCKQVTLATDCLVTSIDVYVRGNNDTVGAATAVLLTDNSGSPHHVLAGSNLAGPYLSNSASMPTAADWLSVPIGRWLTAGTYWICFMGHSSWQIANDGSGSDKYFAPSGGAAVTGTYPSAWPITTGSVKYSIRASILS